MLMGLASIFLAAEMGRRVSRRRAIVRNICFIEWLNRLWVNGKFGFPWRRFCGGTEVPRDLSLFC